MEMATKGPDAGYHSPGTPENHGKSREIYLNYSGPDTITLTREELHHHPNNVAIDELRVWLNKHESNPEMADLCAAVALAMSKAKIA